MDLKLVTRVLLFAFLRTSCHGKRDHDCHELSSNKLPSNDISADEEFYGRFRKLYHKFQLKKNKLDGCCNFQKYFEVHQVEVQDDESMTRTNTLLGALIKCLENKKIVLEWFIDEYGDCKKSIGIKSSADYAKILQIYLKPVKIEPGNTCQHPETKQYVEISTMISQIDIRLQGIVNPHLLSSKFRHSRWTS